MQQLLNIWSALDLRRRVIVIGATIAMFAAVLGLSRMASEPNLSLLYSGLDPAAAGEVVAALEQQGVAYRVREGAIFVDLAQRDALRMTLAAEGLPANTSKGYEILDSLTGFGTTSQMFDAAYWRAKEGELARTIMASPQVKVARVHIANPASNPFQRDIQPTASVTITTTNGNVTGAQAKAFRYLVASAVTGLVPDDVSVIDGRGVLVSSDGENGLGSESAKNKADELKQNIQRIIEARVGHGNVVVEVSVETETDREAIIERRFDPDSRVAISSETEERAGSSSGTQSGAVTVASNLPEGDAGGAGNSSRSENSETRERVNYEVNETTREIFRNPGAIKQLSVAVLVDGLRTFDPETQETNWEPRSEEELGALRELVASAVGFNEARGDTITIKSLEFEVIDVEPQSTSSSIFGSFQINPMRLLQLVVLALVTVVLALFVIRPILLTKSSEASAALPAPAAPVDAFSMAESGAFSNDLSANPLAANTSAFDTGSVPSLSDMNAGALANPVSGSEFGGAPAGLEAPGLGTGGLSPLSNNVDLGAMDFGDDVSDEDAIERLRGLVSNRGTEAVEILRSWMEDGEEVA